MTKGKEANGRFKRRAGDPAAKGEQPSGVAGFLRALGPGFITGASDDDPSGIATYSQVGAQFGYGMLWTMLFTYPLMSAVQEISGRVGRVTGRGLSANIRCFYPRWLLAVLALLLFVANTVNTGTDIAAMAAVLKLVAGGSPRLYALGIGVLSLLLQVFVPYHHYVKYLKWLTLALFAYVAVGFLAHVEWTAALRGSFLPSVGLNSKVLMALLAVLGTTISPYLLYWQASEESEEVKLDQDKKPLKQKPEQGDKELRRIRLDTYVGMAFSNIVAWFIILAAAATLHANGVKQIDTAAQAAEALRPAAGQFAFALFALGIVGTGLLAIPVLAGSAAYAVGEALNWPVGLERKPLQAKGFYAVLAVAILVGVGIAVLKINPIEALVWTAMINGIAAGPILVVVLLMASNVKVMGEKFTIGPGLRVAGWLTAAIMLVATVGLFL